LEEKRDDHLAGTVADAARTNALQQIRSFPLLEAQNEYMLAKRRREHADQQAAHKLVISHLRLVAKIAMGFAATDSRSPRLSPKAILA
jgi:DNA-directed RNA polymerase sigma subunit (sigma70/sigma32)